jgi:polygalacturonase
MVNSEAVAVINVSIWGDPMVPFSGGVVIEGCRRVYLGGNVISTADNALTLKTTNGVRNSCIHTTLGEVSHHHDVLLWHHGCCRAVLPGIALLTRMFILSSRT